MTDDPVRVFVVAPTPLARMGLRSMLQGGEPGVLVVGEASSLSGPELSGADVVVMTGDEALEEADAGEGTQAVLLLSDDDRFVPILRELAPRGWGMVSPDAPSGELAAAVAAVARGLVVLPRELAGRVLGESSTVEEPDEPLTAREREVLGLLLGRGSRTKRSHTSYTSASTPSSSTSPASTRSSGSQPAPGPSARERGGSLSPCSRLTSKGRLGPVSVLRAGVVGARSSRAIYGRIRCRSPNSCQR